ncbi:hypothetical protein NKW55_14990, partial [Gluconobacter kondonii]
VILTTSNQPSEIMSQVNEILDYANDVSQPDSATYSVRFLKPSEVLAWLSNPATTRPTSAQD